MAETSSSPKPLQNPNARDPMSSNTVLSPQNPPTNPKISSPSMAPSPSLDVPRLSSPPLNPLDFQQQQLQQKQLQSLPQAQPSLMSTQNFQIQQSLQRSTSMPRMAQIQQQQFVAMRQQQQQQGGGVYGQMSFSGANASQIQQQQPQQQLQQQTQQQQQQLARSGLIGQVGQSGIHLPMLAGQATAATAAQYNISNQMLVSNLQSRQKAGLVQNTQFHAANPQQQLQAMTGMGMMNQLGVNTPIRGNGTLNYGQQRMNTGVAMRQQQLQQQLALTSPQKLQGQTLHRTASLASMNPQLSGMTQSGQSPMLQSTLSQQWLKQMQPAMSGPGSPYVQQSQQRPQQPQQQQQQQVFIQQQLSSSPQVHQKSINLSQQQQIALLQQQLNSQQPLHQQQQILLQHQQQQSPRMLGANVQKSVSVVGSQIEPLGSGTATPGGSSSQGTEAGNQLLGKRKIQDLVSQIDPRGILKADVLDMLYEVADDFIDSVTTSACSLAKHRKSSILEAKDMILHLEKNWQLAIPGFTSEERKPQKNHFLSSEAHQNRVEKVRALIEASHTKSDGGSARETLRPGITSSAVADHPVRASPSSEQLVLPSVGPMMMQRY